MYLATVTPGAPICAAERKRQLDNMTFYVMLMIRFFCCHTPSMGDMSGRGFIEYLEVGRGSPEVGRDVFSWRNAFANPDGASSDSYCPRRKGRERGDPDVRCRPDRHSSHSAREIIVTTVKPSAGWRPRA